MCGNTQSVTDQKGQNTVFVLQDEGNYTLKSKYQKTSPKSVGWPKTTACNGALKGEKSPIKLLYCILLEDF